MPSFVAKKDYFITAVGSLSVLYLGPSGAPYKFSAPDFLTKGSKSFTPASFDCIWFICLGDYLGSIKAWWDKGGAKKKVQEQGGDAVLADSAESLPQLALDPGKKRREEDKSRRSWRKKLSRQRKQAAKKLSIV